MLIGPKPGPKRWQSVLSKVVLAAGVVAIGYFSYRRFTAPKQTFETAMQDLDRQIQVTTALPSRSVFS